MIQQGDRMKRSQLKSPLGSPAMQQTVRTKQKKGAGGEGTASGSGESFLPLLFILLVMQS